MTFSSSERQNIISRDPLRKKRLQDCKGTSYFYNINQFELIPDDFMNEIDCEGNPFTELFNKILTILSLAYISSTSSINGNSLKGQINGQRIVDFCYELSSVNQNDELFKIYSWIFTDGNSVDKAIIARNIISLHCKYTDLLETDEKTYASIQSNYKLYLKENATQYLELKNKLAEFICDIISKIGDHATMLFGNFKSNLAAIFLFIFSVMLVNITSEQPLNNIFTKDITAIVEFILLGSVGCLIICIVETKYKLKKTKKSYQSLKDNYESILSGSDIDEIFGQDQLLIEAENAVNKGIFWFSVLWGIFLVLAFIFVELATDQPIITPCIKNIFVGNGKI
jgi:hypothetical protein